MGQIGGEADYWKGLNRGWNCPAATAHHAGGPRGYTPGLGMDCAQARGEEVSPRAESPDSPRAVGWLGWMGCY